MTNTPNLSINLSALRANYHLLRERHAKKNIAAVVKANAYGLGMEQVSKTLAAEGCELFFVATLEEALDLRAVLPSASIAVFSGIFKGEEKEFAAHRIIPVMNTLEQLAYIPHVPDYIIHIDTGMTRLGLSATDLSTLPKLSPRMVISHLACANVPDHPKNAEQLARFNEALRYFPNTKASFANSSAHFLPEDYHFDIGRPGCALYGINPRNPVQHVATLSAPILQMRECDRDETVGYGATYAAPKGSRIAIIGMGYADGYFRMLGNQGYAFVAGHKVPIVGRISMDMIALDVSRVPAGLISPDTRAEFINNKQTVDDVATQCNTIGYEIFTRIGRRVKRVYA